MSTQKAWGTILVLPIVVILAALLLSGCDGQATPIETATPPTVQSLTPTPIITIKQELEEQLDMLHALSEAEKTRGNDVSQAERRLDEADQALQSDNLILAREKLREAGEILGVKLP